MLKLGKVTALAKDKKKGNVLKREISAFIREEKGKISKHSLMMMGAIVGSAAAAALVSRDAIAGSVSVTKTGTGTAWTVAASVTHGY